MSTETQQSAQSAREVVARHVEALEQFQPTLLNDFENPHYSSQYRALVSTHIALRALLAQPPSDTVARLVEAAEAAVRTKEAIAPFRAAIALRDAIAAHRASVDALGAVRGRADPEASIHVVLARAAAEAAEQRAAKAERDMDAAVKQAHADLDAANDHAANLVHEIAQLKATHDTAICRRDQIRDAQRERNAVIDALNETRETLRAGPREQAQDAAKRVVAERDRIYDEREILARDRDRALAERDEARKERDVLSAMLRESRAERESTRDALGAGPVEHVVDAAKRVMAELEEVRKRAAQFEAELDEAWEATGVSSTVRCMTDLADVVRSDKRSAKFVREERDDLRVALNEATRQRDEARREAARDREADRRMLKDRDEDYERAAAERDALKTEVERLQAEVRDEREARNRCANAGEEERVQMREDLARLRADPRLGLHFGVCRDGKSLRASFGSWQDAEDSARDWSLKTAKGRYEVVSSGDLNVHVAVSPEAVDEVIAANADKITPPSPAPLDPRALWIADKTWDLQMRFLRVETREDGKSGWSACDASEFVAFATETLRVAEHHAPAPPFRASSSRSLTRASSRSAVRGEEGGGQVSDQTKPALPTLAEIEAEPAD